MDIVFCEQTLHVHIKDTFTAAHFYSAMYFKSKVYRIIIQLYVCILTSIILLYVYTLDI